MLVNSISPATISSPARTRFSRSVQGRASNRPSTNTRIPFLRYGASDSARCPKMITRTHSVRSSHSPSGVRARKLLATLTRSDGAPLGLYRSSGSVPRLPMTLALSISPSLSPRRAVGGSQVASLHLRTGTVLLGEYRLTGHAGAAMTTGQALQRALAVVCVVLGLQACVQSLQHLVACCI